MIFLTGGTGFLGRELLGRLLYFKPEERIGLLIRPQHGLAQDSQFRARALLDQVFGAGNGSAYLHRLEVIQGDLTLENFGMAESDFRALAARTTSVYHCAASTDLNQELERARVINVGGTEQVLRFSDHAVSSSSPNFRLFHVSTAYVAGNSRAVIGADDLNLNGAFRNSYERTKAEAEALVRRAKNRIPICIFRPSIVVGDSVTGETSAFNVIYIPAKLLVKGVLSCLPGCPQAAFDLVPVDYVAEAILRLAAQNHPSGSCFHLTAGLGREASLWQIVEELLSTFNAHRKRGRFIHLPPGLPPELLALAQTSLSMAAKKLEKVVTSRINVFRQALPFIPYMLGNPQFENIETRRALAGCLEEPPLFGSYAEKLFQYCLETNWGKVPWTNPRNLLAWHQRPLSVSL